MKNITVEKRRRDFLIGTSAVLGSAFFASPSSAATSFSAASIVAPSSYTLFQSGTGVSVKNSLTGSIELAGATFVQAMNHALNGVGDSGGIIELGEGIFEVSTPITTTKSFSLIGKGSSATVLRAHASFKSNEPILEFDGGSSRGNVTISDILIEGNRNSGASAEGVYIEDSFNILIERCTFDGFHLAGRSGGSGGNVGIRLLRCHSVLVRDCVFSQCDTGTVLSACSGAMYGCTAYKNEVVGINLENIGDVVQGIVTAFTAVNNFSYGNGTISDVPGHGIRTAKSSRLKIIANHAFQNKQYGILVWDGSNDCIVSQNHAVENERNGIIIHGARDVGKEPVHDCIIEGNECKENRFNGIRAFETRRCLFAGNTSVENDKGIDETFNQQNPITNSDSNVFVENDAHNNKSANFNTGASGNITKNNLNYITELAGSVTLSGDGNKTTFSFPHGLVAQPAHVKICPKTQETAKAFYWDADNTNITITFLTPIETGTNNIAFSWQARV